MAQKNFAQMSTKKLNALLATASEEDKVKIMAVLDARNANAAHAEAAANEPASVATELSPEEQEAIKAAEAANGVADSQAAEATKKKGGRTAAVKLTNEEREELANKLRSEVVNHRCQVVPFNTLEWVDGTIVSIIEEKRNNRVLFAIKLDDGRRVVKSHDSSLIKVLDEVVEPVKKVRNRAGAKLDADGNPIENEVKEWTDEQIEEAVKAVIGNVGKRISYPKTGAMGRQIEGSEDSIETGRIVSLVPAKRTQTILYRILVDVPGDDENAPKKYAHKNCNLKELTIESEFDEEGKQINEAFTNRRYHKGEKADALPKDPAERLEAAKANMNIAEERLKKAQELYEKRKQQLDEAMKAFDEAQNSGTQDNGAQDDGAADLM